MNKTVTVKNNTLKRKKIRKTKRKRREGRKGKWFYHGNIFPGRKKMNQQENWRNLGENKIHGWTMSF